MKCPRCGSEDIETLYFTNTCDIVGWTCHNCRYTLEEDLYQQRLSKVLKKFEDANHGMFSKEFIEDGAIEYSSHTKKFYWTSYSDEFQISLDTVEHLIADMEHTR